MADRCQHGWPGNGPCPYCKAPSPLDRVAEAKPKPADRCREAFEAWWLELTKKGDPRRIPDLARMAFISGYIADRWSNKDAPDEGSWFLVEATGFVGHDGHQFCDPFTDVVHYDADCGGWVNRWGYGIGPITRWQPLPEPAEVKG